MATPFSQLLAAITAGDEAARAELVQRLLPKVTEIVHRSLERDFRRGQRWILPLFSTGDVVQDVLTQLVRDAGAIRGDDEGSVVAYLAAMVRHRLLDAVRFHGAARRDGRRNAELPEGADPRAPHGPATLAEFAEQVKAFEDVLAALPQRHRGLLEARLVDGAQFDEIARRLGYASHDTARKIFHEVHAKLLLQLRARGVRPPGETSA